MEQSLKWCLCGWSCVGVLQQLGICKSVFLVKLMFGCVMWQWWCFGVNFTCLAVNNNFMASDLEGGWRLRLHSCEFVCKSHKMVAWSPVLLWCHLWMLETNRQDTITSHQKETGLFWFLSVSYMMILSKNVNFCSLRNFFLLRAWSGKFPSFLLPCHSWVLVISLIESLWY